ncbi:hypothetical protein LX36DRAFT_136473 [Colletotrichum falcatum]|nr:hypothetical protein LX36DRAFT_136473 [Colletotrichum falcatum]
MWSRRKGGGRARVWAPNTMPAMEGETPHIQALGLARRDEGKTRKLYLRDVISAGCAFEGADVRPGERATPRASRATPRGRVSGVRRFVDDGGALWSILISSSSSFENRPLPLLLRCRYEVARGREGEGGGGVPKNKIKIKIKRGCAVEPPLCVRNLEMGWASEEARGVWQGRGKGLRRRPVAAVIRSWESCVR